MFQYGREGGWRHGDKRGEGRGGKEMRRREGGRGRREGGRGRKGGREKEERREEERERGRRGGRGGGGSQAPPHLKT